jgi:hypothetical protein
MNKLKTLLIAVYTLLCLVDLSAQVNDAQLWADIKLDYKLNKHTSFYAESSLRFTNNISSIGLGYLEVGTEQKLGKMWEVSGGYRFYEKRKKKHDYFSNNHRLNLDLSFKKNFYLFSFQLRTRAEMEYTDIYSSSGSIPAFQWRNKAQVKYSLTKKIKPFFYMEYYFPLSNSDNFELVKSRYCIGSEYKINKHNSLEIYYLIENQFHQVDPNNSYVTGISYICSF